jgi:hypothetical protein
VTTKKQTKSAFKQLTDPVEIRLAVNYWRHKGLRDREEEKIASDQLKADIRSHRESKAAAIHEIIRSAPPIAASVQ